MVKIDLEKFICSLIEHYPSMPLRYKESLKDQGLEYRDGQIVEISGNDGGISSNKAKAQDSKFKVGDWITDGQHTYQISSISNNTVVFSDDNGFEGVDVVKRDYHLWTIQDAKDGDVLVASDSSIFLFAGVDDCSCKYYVALTTCNDVKINKEVEGYWETSRAVHPATQEQCDLLVQKIKESGYEWDAVEKVLKKSDIDNTKDTTTDAIEELTVEKATSLSDGTIIITPEGYTYLLTGNLLYPDNPDVPFSVIRWHKFDYTGCRVANEKETQNYFAKLSANGYVWDSENGEMRKTGINNVNDTIEYEEPNETLTALELKVKDLLGYRQPFSIQDVKEETKILVSLIQKQIIV